MQALERVEVALIHCGLLVKVNLADKFAIIAAHDIRIVFGHWQKPHFFIGEGPLLGFFDFCALGFST